MFARSLALAALVAAGAADAFTVTSTPFDVMPANADQVVFNFDGTPLPNGFSYTGGSIFTTSVGGIAAQPAHDTTPFLALTAGQSAVFSFAHPLTSLSIYIGSVDAYNFLEFTGPGYDSGKFSASVLPGGDNGDQSAGSTNRRFFFTFAPGEIVTSMTLSSASNSFEFDNIALSPIPEPAVWLLLVGGFGLIGATRRRSRMRQHAA